LSSATKGAVHRDKSGKSPPQKTLRLPYLNSKENFLGGNIEDRRVWSGSVRMEGENVQKRLKRRKLVKRLADSLGAVGGRDGAEQSQRSSGTITN